MRPRRRPAQRRPPRRVATNAVVRRQHHQWYWLAAGLVLFFLIPFGLTDLSRSTATSTTASTSARSSASSALWLRYANDVGPRGADPQLASRRRPRRPLRRPQWWRSSSTSRRRTTPGGLEFAAAIAWRGVLYGLADGLILSAFPILAVFAAFKGTARARTPAREGRRRRPRPRRVAAVHRRLSPRLLRLPRREAPKASRRRRRLERADAGDAEPDRAPIAHAGLHVTAVVHSYDTDASCRRTRLAGWSRPDSRRCSTSSSQARTASRPARPPTSATTADTWLGRGRPGDVVTGEPMPTDARMRLESVSKIWTATADPPARRGRNAAALGHGRALAPGHAPLRRPDHGRAAAVHTSGLIDNNDVVEKPRAPTSPR